MEQSDSSAELFGSPTVDGFAKLAVLDSNHDLRIDNNDDAWNSLVVWQDANGDAVTQSGELHSLSSLNIASIDLAGVASSTSTISGNPISHVSKVTFTSGATAAIDDAWFVHDNTNSFYTGDYTLDVDTLFLPTLRGYGTLPDLTIAMSQDSDLKDLVSDFTSTFSMASFTDASDLKDAITEILYQWAGVSDVDPGDRGLYVDAQQLSFLEKLLGTQFVQPAWYGSDPGPNAGAMLEAAYEDAFNMFAANLMVQAGASLFADTIIYSAASGSFTGDMSLSETAIDDLVALAPSPGPDNILFWETVGRFIDSTRGFSNITFTEAGWLDDAVNATDSSLHWSAVVDQIQDDTPGNTVNGTSGADTLNGGAYSDTINGSSGADTIHGNAGRDFIYGDDDNDTLYGDAGADFIHGGNGNDILYGGDGNDTLYGELGNNTLYSGAGGNFLSAAWGDDSYVYGGGADVISDTGGTDQIVLPSGITSGDLTFYRTGSGGSFTDLLIQISGGGTIQIAEQLGSSSSLQIETILFSNSTTLNLTTLSGLNVMLTGDSDGYSTSASGNFNVYGLDGDDTIYISGSGAHTFDGGAGNDSLTAAGSGNDTYIAGPGLDTILESSGTDTIVVPVGYTMDNVTFYRVPGTSGPRMISVSQLPD